MQIKKFSLAQFKLKKTMSIAFRRFCLSSFKYGFLFFATLAHGGCKSLTPIALIPLTMVDGLVLVGTLGVVNPGLTETAESIVQGRPRLGLEIGNIRNIESTVGTVAPVVAGLHAQSVIPSSSNAEASSRYADRRAQQDADNERRREVRNAALEAEKTRITNERNEQDRKYPPNNCMQISFLSSIRQYEIRNFCSRPVEAHWCTDLSCNRIGGRNSSSSWTIPSRGRYPTPNVYWVAACEVNDILVDGNCVRSR